jgi:hypothetical protein
VGLHEEGGVGSGQEKEEIMTRTGVRLLVGVGLLVSRLTPPERAALARC